ncbi:hypothetical protein HY469_02735 [Candidatus Roizmanbacteria bacterium]|nr:hypothetical protein [Candidatus Roizmanbacteria bacterium]
MNKEQKLLGDYYYNQEERESTFQNAISFPFYSKPERFMRPEERLAEPFTIGVPKSKGEFNGGILTWARKYGFEYDENTRRLSFENRNGSKLFLLRTSDIMSCLARGELTYGLVGAEKIWEYYEWDKQYTPVQPLCFGASKFCLGFRDNEYPYLESPEQMRIFLAEQADQGKKIATSLTETLSLAFLWTKGLTRDDIKIIEKFTYQPYLLEGSVEAALSVAPEKVFAVADIVESGETAMANGIRADYQLLELPGAFIVRFDPETRKYNEARDRAWKESLDVKD